MDRLVPSVAAGAVLLLGGCAASDPTAAPAPTVASAATSAPAPGTPSAPTAPTASDPSTPDPSTPDPATPEPSTSGTATPATTPESTGTPTPTLSSSPTPSATATSEPSSPAAPAVLRRGAEGAEVEAVQRRLSELGYWLGTPDGKYGHLTQQAVYALQKAAGLGRDGVVGPRTRIALDKGVRPKAHSTSGTLVEIDLDRQLLLLVSGGRVQKAFNTSTGTFEEYVSQGRTMLADTPRGTWTVYRQVDRWDKSPLGELYRPKYFNKQGIAVHGFPSVPPYAASHGCARVSLAAMDWLWSSGRLDIGTTVLVF